VKRFVFIVSRKLFVEKQIIALIMIMNQGCSQPVQGMKMVFLIKYHVSVAGRSGAIVNNY